MIVRIAMFVVMAVGVFGVPTGAAQAPAAQQELSGSWVGVWERDGSALDVELVFARDAAGYTGSFSSDQLRVVGIPFERVRFEAPRASWALAGDATTMLFDGTIEGDTLAGRYDEGPAAGTFRLTRRKSPPQPVRGEDVSFANGAVSLSGTLVRPAGDGPFPCVVFLHGSGGESRWASRFLANAMARNGIAGFIYDKRGVGTSTGDWRQAGFEDLVGDAVAAVDAMRTRPGIDPTRIGIHGHSQGGTIAPMVATASAHVAFVVGSAASGVSMAECEIFSLDNAVGARGLPDTERVLAERFVRAVVATAYDGAPREKMVAAWQAVRDKPWAFEPPAETDSYWAFSKRIASFKPLDHWRRVTVPALLVYGDADERVPARASATRIADAYLGAGGRSVTVHVFPGADHTFRLGSAAPGKFAWPRSAAGYPDVVVEWIRKVASMSVSRTN